MRYRDLIGEEYSIFEIVELFVEYAMSELSLTHYPKITITTDGELGTTFGSYDPESDVIYVEISNRHPIDILRTLAHEMVHFRQDKQGVLRPDSGNDGSDHENEANSEAGRIMRKFGKRKPELFRINTLNTKGL